MHRITHTALLAGTLALVVGSPARASSDAPSLVHLATMHDGVAIDGTGVVVGTERAGQVTWVLTAGALFRRADGEPAADPVQVTVGGRTVVVPPERILRPVGDLTGIALLVIHGLPGETLSMKLDYAAPAVGGVFVIAGLSGGMREDVAERVQFVATRLVVGDRLLAGIDACLGAPALSERGVLGIVTDCAGGRAPVVTLVSTSRAFLARHLATAMQTRALPEPAPRFTVSERLVNGPLMTVACDAVNAGEVDVPYQLGRNERAVDASASFLNATELRLADVAVLHLNERSVRLRFTMVGVPPAAYAVPGACRQGQALLTVRLNLVVLPPQ